MPTGIKSLALVTSHSTVLENGINDKILGFGKYSWSVPWSCAGNIGRGPAISRATMEKKQQKLHSSMLALESVIIYIGFLRHGERVREFPAMPAYTYNILPNMTSKNAFS